MRKYKHFGRFKTVSEKLTLLLLLALNNFRWLNEFRIKLCPSNLLSSLWLWYPLYSSKANVCKWKSLYLFFSSTICLWEKEAPTRCNRFFFILKCWLILSYMWSCPMFDSSEYETFSSPILNQFALNCLLWISNL